MTFLQNEIREIIKNYNISEDVKNKIFVVSGASGLIGNYVSALIANAGGKVIAISRSGNVIKGVSNIRYIHGSVCESAYDSITEADYIIHAASPATPKIFDEDPVGVIRTNIAGTFKALDLARRTGAKLLLTSSSEIYGENIHNRALKEEDSGLVDSVAPRACYTESKRLAENLCVNYDRQFGTKSIIARIAFCYGGNFTASDNRVVPQFIRMALKDKKIIMKSSGGMKRSYVYVGDVAAAIIKLLTSSYIGAINICNDEIVSIRQLAQVVCNFTGAVLEIDRQYLNNEQGAAPFSGCVLDCSKLKGLGFMPQFDIHRGIRSAIEIFKERNNA